MPTPTKTDKLKDAKLVQNVQICNPKKSHKLFEHFQIIAKEFSFGF